MGHFFQVFLSNYLALPGSESMFCLSQGPPVCVCVCLSQSRWILVKRPMGRLTSFTMRRYPLSFDLQGAFLHTCSWEGLLDLRNEEYVVFYLGRAQPPPSSSFYGVSAIEEFLSTGEKLCSLEPTRLLPQ